MSANIIAFPKRVATIETSLSPLCPATALISPSEYFGGCPTCGRTDGYVNSGPSHWFICVEHRVRWCVGSNLFSDWREETVGEQRQRFGMVAKFAEIEPIYPRATA